MKRKVTRNKTPKPQAPAPPVKRWWPAVLAKTKAAVSRALAGPMMETLERLALVSARPLALLSWDGAGMTWLRAGGDSEEDLVLGIGQGDPGATGSGRMFILYPPAPKPGLPSSGAILVLPLRYLPPGSTREKGVAITPEAVMVPPYRTDFDTELWIEWAGGDVPGGGTGGVFRFAHTSSVNGQIKTHDQPGSTIDLQAPIPGTGDYRTVARVAAGTPPKFVFPHLAGHGRRALFVDDEGTVTL